MLNRFALGTVQFGLDYGISNTKGQVPFHEAQKILSFAKQFGITTLDTASGYGNSENIIGKLTQANSVDRDCIRSFDVITKLSIKNKKTSVTEQMANSLKSLQTDSVYAVMIHDVDELLASNGRGYQELIKLKESKICKKIGVSVYSPEQLKAVLNRFDVNIVQFPINILDQRFLQNNFLAELKKQQIELHARSLFLQGLLLMDDIQIPIHLSKYNKQLLQISSYCKNFSLTKLSACLAFAKSLKQIDKFVIGVNSSKQLEQIINTYILATANTFSQFSTQEEKLINPSLWHTLN